MPANKNALLRYKTIDKCLSNPYRKWSLDDLIDACSDALYDCESIDKGISKRTIQADIQIMRSDKLGYNAPIEVYDNKYYRYTNTEYTITQMPLSQHDLEKLTEVMDILKQFKEFSYFQELSGMVQKLEDKLYAEQHKQKPVIVLETNEGLKGLEFLDKLYEAIITKTTLTVHYQSFKAREASQLILSPYLLKEYRNRWFVIGRIVKSNGLINLALDRIIAISKNETQQFIEDSTFDPKNYYDNTIGVTVLNQRPHFVHLWVDNTNAPYVITKPIHPSQEIISRNEDGIEIRLKVHLNFELEREILGFGESMEVIKPEGFRKRILSKLNKAVSRYETTKLNSDANNK